MKHPDFLDNRDFTGEDKKRPSTMSMDTSYQALEGVVKKLSEIASTRHDPRYLQEYIKTGINMAQSEASDHDFTVLIRSGREMYRANCVFAPYRHIRKISVFGSARIRNDEPAYETAREFAREASEHGYMVITGGGPGIMQAANEGAGEQRSFGPECEEAIPWYLNIPVLSWLALRGKSACCGTRISFRYCFVELLTALLFAALGWKYADASAEAAVLLCLWTAMAIVIMFIDAEHLIVFRTQALIGAAAGVGACALYPFLLPDNDVMTWTDAFTASVLGGIAGYAAIRLVIELGKLLFGTWKQHFDAPAPWSLKEPESDRDELQLIINGQPHDWSMLFHRATDKAVISGGSVTIDGETLPPCSVILRQDRIELENGDVFPLEDLESVEGTMTDIRAQREAMGSGDAWILMMAGCVGGWQGAVFCLFLGSLLGIVQAVVSRMGFGRNLPFGPALLSAALIWLLGGDQWWLAYLRFISGE